RDAEQYFVRRIGQGMTGFGQQRGRPGEQAGRQFRRGDDEIGGERDGNGAGALALRRTPEGGVRAPRRQPAQHAETSPGLCSPSHARDERGAGVAPATPARHANATLPRATRRRSPPGASPDRTRESSIRMRSEEHTSELQSPYD